MLYAKPQRNMKNRGLHGEKHEGGRGGKKTETEKLPLAAAVLSSARGVRFDDRKERDG